MGKRQRRRLREHQYVQFRRPDLQAARDPTAEATARLRRLVEQRMRIAHEIDVEVDRLHGWGFDWPTIASALGVTRQAARQRHLRHFARRPQPGDTRTVGFN